MTRTLLLAAALALTPAIAMAAAAPQSAAEVKYTGGVWRGSIGDRIEVTFKEGGRDQTISGVLAAVERYVITLEVEVAGKAGRKVIVLGDVKSVKLVSEGDGAAATAAPGSEAGDTTTAPTTTPTTTSAPATTTRRGSVIEEPDTAGPITGPRTDGKKTVFVLPLPGMVGTGLRQVEIERIEKEADKLGPGQIIVMRINSGGGLVTEGDLIHVSLSRIKKKHRLVAWIEEAISGAAFTALHADEIYFMDVGSLGAISMGSGGISVKGAQLDAWLDKIYEICELGGRPGFLCRCMVHSSFEASYSVDPETGRVTWHADTSGDHVVSAKGDNLSFNATDAVRSKFAQGRANTEAELFKAMLLEEGTYVVSHAGKKIAADWKRIQEQVTHEVPRLIQDYQIKGAARDAEAALGIRINALNKMISWWKRADPVMRYELNAPPLEYLEELLAQLKKELADLQKQKARERREG